MISMKMDHGDVTVSVECTAKEYIVNNREFLTALDKLLKCVDSYDNVDIRIQSNDYFKDIDESSKYDEA